MGVGQDATDDGRVLGTRYPCSTCPIRPTRCGCTTTASARAGRRPKWDLRLPLRRAGGLPAAHSAETSTWDEATGISSYWSGAVALEVGRPGVDQLHTIEHPGIVYPVEPVPAEPRPPTAAGRPLRPARRPPVVPPGVPDSDPALARAGQHALHAFRGRAQGDEPRHVRGHRLGGVPDSVTSCHAGHPCPARLAPACFVARADERLLEDVEALGEILVVDHDRNEDADDVRVEPAGEQDEAALARRTLPRRGARRSLGLAVLDELEASIEPRPRTSPTVSTRPAISSRRRRIRVPSSSERALNSGSTRSRAPPPRLRTRRGCRRRCPRGLRDARRP